MEMHVRAEVAQVLVCRCGDVDEVSYAVYIEHGTGGMFLGQTAGEEVNHVGITAIVAAGIKLGIDIYTLEPRVGPRRYDCSEMIS